MIILYLKDSPNIEQCRFHLSIVGISSLMEKDGKIYQNELFNAVANDTAKVGWFAVPEQPINIPEQYLDEDGSPTGQPLIGELKLTHFKAGELGRLQRDPLAEIDGLKARIMGLEAKSL